VLHQQAISCSLNFANPDLKPNSAVSEITSICLGWDSRKDQESPVSLSVAEDAGLDGNLEFFVKTDIS
jgi:hypothetical protein